MDDLWQPEGKEHRGRRRHNRSGRGRGSGQGRCRAFQGTSQSSLVDSTDEGGEEQAVRSSRVGRDERTDGLAVVRLEDDLGVPDQV